MFIHSLMQSKILNYRFEYIYQLLNIIYLLIQSTIPYPNHVMNWKYCRYTLGNLYELLVRYRNKYNQISFIQ